MPLGEQWELLHALWPSLMPMLTGSTERVVACNLDHLDDALAVTLAHFHRTPIGGVGTPAGGRQFLMFYAGAPPARSPVQWHRAELRGVPKQPWLEPVVGQPSRWAPHSRVMESVVLGPPPGPVDLLVAETPAPHGRGSAWPIDGVRQGGHLLVTRPGCDRVRPGADWEMIDRGGHLYRRLTPPNPCPQGRASDDAGGPTLARHHERAMLIASYTTLARSLARRFSRRGERSEDLEQVALLALVRAADRYDPEKGQAFGPFAAVSISGELKRHFRDKMWAVRVPRSMQEMYLAVRVARDDLAQSTGSSPTIAQIAERLDTTEESVLAAMEAATNSWTVSLDAPPSDAGAPVVDLPTLEAGFDATVDRDLLKESISRLAPTEKLVLKRLFFDGLSQRDVAEELRVSQMQVSRLKIRTIQKMRQDFEPVEM